jgi:NAD(P)-dependent dehydrogenase (short-subunit alcohol dehydrogenase family)
MPLNEDLRVTNHHKIYPGIDPARFSGTAARKVVFITGASGEGGIGEHTAIAFARAGASVFIIARRREGLERTAGIVKKSVPDAQVLFQVADVTVKEQVEDAVAACITAFGSIDVVVSNAGRSAPWKYRIGDCDPQIWWQAFEVNIKGNFLVAHCTIKHVVQSKGYIIFVTSVGAQYRTPTASSYQTAKHALNRFTEFIQTEYGKDGVKAFALHPGSVRTEMSCKNEQLAPYLIDEPNLAAATMVRIVSGSEDWLSGRYISANWDLDEVAMLRNRIVEDDALKNSLRVPLSPGWDYQNTTLE